MAIAKAKEDFPIPNKPAPRFKKEGRSQGIPDLKKEAREGRTRKRTASLDARERSRSNSTRGKRPDFRDRHGLMPNEGIDDDGQDRVSESYADSLNGDDLDSDVEFVNEVSDTARVEANANEGEACISEEDRKLMGGKGSGRRGRPITTGIGEVKKLAARTKEMMETKKKIEDMKDPSVPARLSISRQRKEKEELEALNCVPTLEMTSVIIDAIRGLDKAINASGNIKGTYRGEMVRAAATISAATKHLATRLGDPLIGINRDVEIEELRRKITTQQVEIDNLRALREENTRLREQSDQLQRQVGALEQQVQSLMATRQQQTEQETLPSERYGKRKRKAAPRILIDSEEDKESMGISEQMPGMEPTENMELERDMEQEPELEKTEEEREEIERAERKRLAILEDIQRDGMPEVSRPPLQGKSMVISPAVPPAQNVREAKIDKKKVHNKVEEQIMSLSQKVDVCLSLSQRVDDFLRGMASGQFSHGTMATPPATSGEQVASTGAIDKRSSKRKNASKKEEEKKTPPLKMTRAVVATPDPPKKGGKKEATKVTTKATPGTSPAELTDKWITVKGKGKENKGKSKGKETDTKKKEPAVKEKGPSSKKVSASAGEG